MSPVPSIELIDIDDYLAMEINSEVKHKYYQGEIFAMTGETIGHNQVVRNTLIELNQF